MDTESFAALRGALAGLIERYHLLKHPFYRAWNAGALDREILKNYTKQYFKQELAFPRHLAAIYAKCDKLEDRQAVLRNLVEEDHGPDNHSELLLRFAEGLGLSREEVWAEPALDETAATVATFERLCQQGSAAEGMAAVYAYEAMIPEVAESKLSGLRQHYGIEDQRTTAFFSVHESADREHRAWDLELLRRLTSEGSESERVVASAEQACQAMWGFLDGVSQAYLPSVATLAP